MVGLCYMKGYGAEKSNQKALDWYKKAAEQNDIYALEDLAWLYISGENVEHNYEEAMKIGKSLLEKENSDAGQHIIGYLYDYGYGVEINDATTFSWYLKSAEQGNKICQYNTGMFYTEGFRTEQNRDLGKQWLEKSALQGYKDALKYLMENY